MRLGICIRPPGYDHRARAAQTDVDRAMEVLDVEVCAESACIRGGVHDVRRRLDDLLDDLLPPVAPPSLGECLLRRLGVTARAKAADAALDALLVDCPPGTRLVAICCEGYDCPSGVRGSPEDALREHVADALDEAYCVMLPHEAARRRHLYAEVAGAVRTDPS